MTETRIREEICRLGRSLFERGLTPGSSGNISVRRDDGGWMVTPTNASLGSLDPARLSRLELDIVLEGEVKLSINSSEGRRLSLRIARKGDILGLASALSGSTYETTAETVYPARLVPIGRREFLGFMLRHPEAYQVFSEELTHEFTMACEQLRTVGLSTSAPEKLARLLLDWSENGQTFESGTKFRFSMTHEEIGEFIGSSRETVTRTLSVFKHERLVAFNGSILTIPSKAALASYAGC